MPAFALPALLVHYSRSPAPFRSLTRASPALVASLGPDDCWGLARFRDPEYLPARVRTEARLRRMLIATGGRPRVEHPCYATLGRHPAWQRQTRPGMSAWLIPWPSAPDDALSFTVGDSLIAHHPAWARARGLTDPLHRRLLRSRDLRALFRHPPTPDPVRLLRQIEVQLWWRPTGCQAEPIDPANALPDRAPLR